eukprot:TRINITY_DN11434_c0_g1_i1.p1 TRINITY_DN11434_c0_g1~~TRINITY_DN11434_c0_g1_i1.p1  ORF type:complete len:363 (-),score=35.43 TRINITY_DN11434_c0_g1_i1:73-1161(-)
MAEPQFTFDINADHGEISKRYTFGFWVGSGKFSVVMAGRDKITKEDVAIKCVLKDLEDKNQRFTVMREVQIMRKICKHPNIVKFYHFSESDRYYFMVMELIRGEEMFECIRRREEEQRFYTEEQARTILKQIGSAVYYLHSHGVVHRDLKLENLMWSQPNESGTVKIIDFGLARFAAGDEDALNSPCGTPGYTAPELAVRILNHRSSKILNYTRSVDMWSLGIIAYTLLCGYPPFSSEDDEELLEMSAEGLYSFPSPYWDGISKEAKNLVARLLTKDPSKRITAKMFLADAWISNTPQASLLNKLYNITLGYALGGSNKPPTTPDEMSLEESFSEKMDLSSSSNSVTESSKNSTPSETSVVS